MTTDIGTKYFVLAIAGAEAVVYSVIIFMAMTGTVLFRPELTLGAGPAITSVCIPISCMIAFGVVHPWDQRWLSRSRPAVVPWTLKTFDVITTFLPVVTLVYSYLVSTGHATWWIALQGVYALTVIGAIIEDMVDIYRQMRGQPKAQIPVSH